MHGYVEFYMDEFMVYGNNFEEALQDLEIILKWCQETNISLSHEKCKILLTGGISFDTILLQRELELIQPKLK